MALPKLLKRKKQVTSPLPKDVAETASERERREAAEAQRAILTKAEAEAAKAHRDDPAPPEHHDEPIIKRQKPKLRKRPVKELLSLAGIGEEPAVIKKQLIRIGVFITFALTLFATVLALGWSDTFASRSGSLQFVWFLIAMWTVGLVAMLFLVVGVYAFIIDLKINTRRKEIETVFPDYLQLAAANLAAGMTIDRALWSAVRPRFGVLAKEMEDVAKKTMTGRDLERSLQEFSHKYDSLVIKRSIDLICEGTRSGGRMADILSKIAVNIQENTILQKEMSANVTTYVIFISFASVLASPFLFGLSTQLLAVIQQIAGTLASDGSGSSSVGLSISGDAVKMDDFRLFSILVLAITSIMSACIVAVIRKGTVKEGLKSIPIYFIISLLLYLFATWVLGFLFRGFLTG